MDGAGFQVTLGFQVQKSVRTLMLNPFGFESQTPSTMPCTLTLHPRNLECDLAIQLYVQLLMTNFFEDVNICVAVVLPGVSNRSIGCLPWTFRDFDQLDEWLVECLNVCLHKWVLTLTYVLSGIISKTAVLAFTLACLLPWSGCSISFRTRPKWMWFVV